jgi:maltose O-acetyltransferase
VILNVAEVTIGDRTQIGPGVQILAADHPRDPAERGSGLEFGSPVRIGATSGSGRERLSCRAFRSVMMR